MKPSRILLIAIVATAVSYIGSFAALGSSFPTIDASGEEIVAWFSANGSSARTYAWCSAFISLGFVIFGAQVAALLPRAHGYVFLGGILGWAITAQVQAWFWAGLSFHPQDLDPATARVIFAIPAYWGPIINGSSATVAAPLVALGLAASSGVPRWLGWLSLLFFVEQVVETITVYGRSGFLAPGGVMNVYVGGAIGFVWVAGVTRWAMEEVDSAADR